MSCLESQAWMQRRMDGAQEPVSDALEHHWSECAVCRDQCAGAQRLLEGLKMLPRPRLSPGFVQQLTAAVMDDRRRRQAKVRRRVFVTMALAASVLILLLVGYAWTPRDVPAKGLVVDAPPKKSDPAPQPPPPEPKLVQKQEPRNAITSLTERWADATRDHAKVVLAATNLDAVEELPAVNVLPPMDPGIRDAGQEVSEGVRAVTQNTRRAFSFFARELPMPELEAKAN